MTAYLTSTQTYLNPWAFANIQVLSRFKKNEEKTKSIHSAKSRQKIILHANPIWNTYVLFKVKTKLIVNLHNHTYFCDRSVRATPEEL